ncbi:unnamed protein product [Didymodactylos carnosus]|uniref:Ubiquitin-like protein NEDD8 n=1 Tax=Didymodactylos carnosus TaxID=1234261 RepID=A0A813WC76_9BILA|nr:unnamed protein product [Didymodactylos carnosus]CAF0850145.1 unnamed protein product [Didymodactylos carnosus]CAF3576235.1 unnamed protein product [Didymodactylos carnosus]CAF3637777.1 unnamed protein product [Didymodactylos carnosus]
MSILLVSGRQFGDDERYLYLAQQVIRSNYSVKKIVKMLIKVKTLTGKEIEVDVEPQDKIERIKERVEEKEGIPPPQQRLIFSGKQMNDEKTVQDYAVTAGCVLHLVLALRVASYYAVLALIPTADKQVAGIYLYRNNRSRLLTYLPLDEYTSVTNCTRTIRPVPKCYLFELRGEDNSEIFGASDVNDRTVKFI